MQDGKLIAEASQEGDWEKMTSGWWYDAHDQRLWLRVADARDTAIEVAGANQQE